MAAAAGSFSPLHIPVRSISLPSRFPSNCLQVEAQPNPEDTILAALTRLSELFNCSEQLLQAPLTQQAFRHCHFDLLEEAVLEGSVGLLDVCSTSRDLFLTLKQHVQDLQSALRRRGLDSSIDANINAYVCFRKKAKKDVAKSMKLLRRMETKTTPGMPTFPPADSSNIHLVNVIKVLKETTRIAISTFRSLLLYLSANDRTLKNRSLSTLISKVMKSGLFFGQDEKVLNVVGSVDMAMSSIRSSSNGVKINVQEMQRRLETLDGGIGEIEAELDCLFKTLIRNRVSILNLVTPY